MTMPHWIELVLVVVAGTVLGIFFFGGLAFTVRRMVEGRAGAFHTLFSFLLRASVVIGCFWLLSRNRAENWIACLAGFTLAKIAVSKVGFFRAWFEPSQSAKNALVGDPKRREDRHAPHA
jgi:F1F0 ATPase subunit 2